MTGPSPNCHHIKPFPSRNWLQLLLILSCLSCFGSPDNTLDKQRKLSYRPLSLPILQPPSTKNSRRWPQLPSIWRPCSYSWERRWLRYVPQPLSLLSHLPPTPLWVPDPMSCFSLRTNLIQFPQLTDLKFKLYY